jgi:hypothetical protein
MKELVKKLMALIVKLKVSLQILFSPVTSNGNAPKGQSKMDNPGKLAT